LLETKKYLLLFKKLSVEVKNEIEKVFKELDLDGNGSLTIEECFAYWKNFPMTSTSNMISQLDANNDGEVSYDEWLNFWEYLYYTNHYTDEMLMTEVIIFK